MKIAKDDKLEQLIDKIIYKSIVSLEDTKALIDMETLDKSVSFDYVSAKDCIFGMGASLLVGKDAYLKFLRINKNCMVHEDFHMQMVQAKNLCSKDAAVIISYSGMTNEIVRCAEIAKNAGVPVIAINLFQRIAVIKACRL